MLQRSQMEHPFTPRKPSIHPLSVRSVGSSSFIEWYIPSEYDSPSAESPLYQKLQEQKPLCPTPETMLLSAKQTRRVLEELPSISPALFIFHSSRCGSTLLARLLEVEQKNRVFIENKTSSAILAERHTSPQELFPLMIRALGAGFLSGQERLILKFSSNATFRIREIKELFPDVPCWFLYRDPIEVFASNFAGSPHFLEASSQRILSEWMQTPLMELEHLDRTSLICRYLKSLLNTVLENQSCFSRFISYPQLLQDPEKLLTGWISARNADFQDTLRHDAKRNNTTFVSDSKRKQEQVTPEQRSKIMREVFPRYLQTKRIGKT